MKLQGDATHHLQIFFHNRINDVDRYDRKRLSKTEFGIRSFCLFQCCKNVTMVLAFKYQGLETRMSFLNNGLLIEKFFVTLQSQTESIFLVFHVIKHNNRVYNDGTQGKRNLKKKKRWTTKNICTRPPLL